LEGALEGEDESTTYVGPNSSSHSSRKRASSTSLTTTIPISSPNLGQYYHHHEIQLVLPKLKKEENLLWTKSIHKTALPKDKKSLEVTR